MENIKFIKLFIIYKGCFLDVWFSINKIFLQSCWFYSWYLLYIQFCLPFHNEQTHSRTTFANRANDYQNDGYVQCSEDIIAQQSRKFEPAKIGFASDLLLWIMRILRDTLKCALKTLLLLWSRVSKKTWMSPSLNMRKIWSYAHSHYGRFCGVILVSELTKCNSCKNWSKAKEIHYFCMKLP